MVLPCVLWPEGNENFLVLLVMEPLYLLMPTEKTITKTVQMYACRHKKNNKKKDLLILFGFFV